MARILLVEDDDDVRLVIQEALLQAGHVVSVAANLQQAAEALDSLACDLLVTDVVLRGVQGFEVAELAAARGIRTLFLTGAPDQLARLSALGAPYLAKPFHLKEVVAAAARLLGEDRTAPRHAT